MQRILVIAPHADDELIGCAGTLLKHIRSGNQVYVCIVTRGAEPLFSKELVEEVRKETLRAHEALGVSETFFLEHPAVMLEDVPRYQLNGEIMDIIQKVQPDEVYIPHFGDMQKDHQLVAEAVMVAVRPKYEYKIKHVYAYETLSETEWNTPHTTNAFIPTVYVDISDFIENKLELLSIFKTQMADFPQPRSLKAVQALAQYRGSTITVNAAEAFALIREIR